MSEAEQSPDPDNYRGRKSKSTEDVKGKGLKAKGNEKPVQMDFFDEAEGASERPGLKKPKEEHNSEIGIPTSEIQNKSEIENRNSEIKPMEVHHHPEVEKKGFKEYLLEGLMIFIAVMMGFFAESLREHISENERAKEYAVTLYSDLKADTVSLDKYLKRINFGAAQVDTLMQLLSENDPKDIPSGKLYWYGLFGGLPLNFAPHDATLLEMKSSGSLRFFTNHAINRMLAEYDQRLQFFKSTEQNELGIYTEVRVDALEIMNG